MREVGDSLRQGSDIPPVQSVWLGMYKERPEPLRNPFPWLREEKSADGTRLMRRCSELDGGCGDVVEVPAVHSKRFGTHFPGFIAWYRQHLTCGRHQ